MAVAKRSQRDETDSGTAVCASRICMGWICVVLICASEMRPRRRKKPKPNEWRGIDSDVVREQINERARVGLRDESIAMCVREKQDKERG